jgi:hypothetical protein
VSRIDPRFWVHTALPAEERLSDSWALTDAGLLTEAGVDCRPDQVTRLLGLEGVVRLAWHRGRLVWLLADQIIDREKQVDEIREESSSQRTICRWPRMTARPFGSRSSTRPRPGGSVMSSPRTRLCSWRTTSSRPCTRQPG